MLIYNPPHTKNPCPSVCQKHSCFSCDSCSKKKSIRVPKTFVLFELFVFKEKIHPYAKNIRAIRAIRVQRKNSIRVPKTFDIREIRIQKSSPPKSHTPMQNPDGPPLSYSISVTFPSLMKNEQSYFRIFLPFFITTPACRLPLIVQPERSYSLPSIAFVVRADVMPDFM